MNKTNNEQEYTVYVLLRKFTTLFVDRHIILYYIY